MSKKLKVSREFYTKTKRKIVLGLPWVSDNLQIIGKFLICIRWFKMEHIMISYYAVYHLWYYNSSLIYISAHKWKWKLLLSPLLFMVRPLIILWYPLTVSCSGSHSFESASSADCSSAHDLPFVSHVQTSFLHWHLTLWSWSEFGPWFYVQWLHLI